VIESSATGPASEKISTCVVDGGIARIPDVRKYPTPRIHITAKNANSLTCVRPIGMSGFIGGCYLLTGSTVRIFWTNIGYFSVDGSSELGGWFDVDALDAVSVSVLLDVSRVGSAVASAVESSERSDGSWVRMYSGRKITATPAPPMTVARTVSPR